jgi:hypothetical protein
VYDAVTVKELESLKCMAVRTALFGTTGGQDLQDGFYEEEHFTDVGEILVSEGYHPIYNEIEKLAPA